MKPLYTPIARCRGCRSTALTSVLSLGELPLSGVFPRSESEVIPRGPLSLVRCSGECGLVQLAHDYDVGVLYGDRYGYRSGLNQAMVHHLRDKVASIVAFVGKTRPLTSGDTVLDIGSNDGTLLASYPTLVNLDLVGMDPTAARFANYYAKHTRVVPELFAAASFLRATSGEKARIVTSIAMFYDLPDPVAFAREVHDVLADDGIWHFEQSYLPAMLDACSYDTICHEHLEYYALGPVGFILDRAGFEILDVSLNDANGGSFAVTARKAEKPDNLGEGAAPVVRRMLAEERARGLRTDAPYLAFAARVSVNRVLVRALLQRLRDEGKRVVGLGASTKGNVLLDYCGIGPELLPAIAEVNHDKVGAFTPGGKIPIIEESTLSEDKPDYLFVLPWHFRAAFLRKGGIADRVGVPLVFPLPELEIVEPSGAHDDGRKRAAEPP